jgi:cyclohexa-1,5-dienecarbonyl-CoA hydratase
MEERAPSPVHFLSQTSLQFARISLHLNPPIAHLLLAHPPANVIDIAMMEELAAVLSEIDVRTEISILIVAGAGNCFSAGVDVVAHTPDKISEMLQKFHAVIRALVSTKKITIAAVHGNCLGGAAELAMVCDVVITGETATWGFPEIKLGCFPPVAAAALSALVGQKRAGDLILTGRSITGSQAARMGLATLAVPDQELSAAVEERLAALRALSPTTLAIAKKAIYSWDAMHFEKGLKRAEDIYLDDLIKSEDAQEGIRAFLEKRSPLWKSR